MSGGEWAVLIVAILIFAACFWLVGYSQRVERAQCECDKLSPKAREQGKHCVACHTARRCGCRFEARR